MNGLVVKSMEIVMHIAQDGIKLYKVQNFL